MKTILNVLSLILLSFPVFAQTSGQVDAFNKYKSCFPLYNYPFNFSQDNRKRTEINTYAKKLPAGLLKQFIYDQGIKPTAWACGPEWVLDYESYIQFPPLHNFYLLVITADITPPCGESTYLLSYDRQGKLIDTLLISAQGFLTMPSEENKSGEYFAVESIVTKDTIYIERREEIGKLMEIDEKKRKYRQLTYKYIYIFNKQGRFVLVNKEDKKDEMMEYELR
jgi:hypothetical protein